jgi:hypothetical protein
MTTLLEPREYNRLTLTDLTLKLLEASKARLGGYYKAYGLHLLEKAIRSQVYSVEVRGVRETVYASYVCPTQPYITFTLEEREVTLDVVLAYNISPVYPRDPWLKRLERVDRLCVAHVAIDLDYRNGLEAKRLAREGLVYFSPEKAWGEASCTVIRPHIARWYVDWGRRQLASQQ